MTGRLIAIVGPSGVGKDSVMAAVAAVAPQIAVVRRVITRPQDAGGEAFDSVDVAQFEAMQQSAAFVLHWSAHGLSYGVPVSVTAQVAQGRDVMANLSRGVLGQAAVQFPGLVVVALTADPDVLARRLAARGREDDAAIARRLKRDGAAVPPGIAALKIANDGPIGATAQAILARLYPVRA